MNATADGRIRLGNWRGALGAALTPVARAWIRYAPVEAGKPWLWQNFHWRERAFTCRTLAGDLVSGNTQDLIQRHLYYFGTWEPNISRWIGTTLRPGDGFVDVGANIGHYSLLAARLVGDGGRVVAIEAAHWIHATLDRHVALNGHANVRTVQAAASDRRGTIKLYHGHAGNIGKTTTVARDGASSEVAAIPLAEILDDDEIARTRIIKIDVEGAELEVLRGLAPLLPKLRQDVEIVMEITPSVMPGGEAARDEIFATLTAHGFRAYVFDNDYEVATYLSRGPAARPVALTDPALARQADVLFSRAAY